MLCHYDCFIANLSLCRLYEFFTHANTPNYVAIPADTTSLVHAASTTDLHLAAALGHLFFSALCFQRLLGVFDRGIHVQRRCIGRNVTKLLAAVSRSSSQLLTAASCSFSQRPTWLSPPPIHRGRARLPRNHMASYALPLFLPFHRVHETHTEYIHVNSEQSSLSNI